MLIAICICLQEILKTLVSGKPFTFENTLQKRFLVETGVLDCNLSKIELELLRVYIQKQIEVDMLQRDEYIKIGDALVYLPNLSPQIEKILLLLYKNKNSVVSRDQIAMEIWGEDDYIDKYSDYSIDKQISKLRKVIEDSNGKSEILETKKGKGYLLNI